MSVMFAAPSGGGRPTNGNLYEFKAGIANLEPGSGPIMRKVVADKTPGIVYIKQTPDQLMHFCWKNRDTGVDVLDLIVFPGDAEFIKIKECIDGRMFMLKFKNASEDRRIFWLQQPSQDKDEEIVKKVNEYLNNPPPRRARAGGGAKERQMLANLAGSEDVGALANMDQNQLMQLITLMQCNSGGSDMLPAYHPVLENEAAMDEPTGSVDPLPVALPVAPSGIGNPAQGSSVASGGNKKQIFKADQLRSILSKLSTKSADTDGATQSGDKSALGSVSKESETGAKKRRPAEMSADIPDVDAQINADANAQESTESVVREPSAKKGKTDHDNMDMD